MHRDRGSSGVARIRLTALVLFLLGAPGTTPGQEARDPGSGDPFPQGCVSCHVVLPDGMDVRLSTLMAGWQAGVGPELLAAAQAASPGGVTLSGRHPDPGESLADVPAGCLTCHGRDARSAPPFARLMHRVHLTGGESNPFVTMFGGACTHCHKLDPDSGAWSLPSGREL